MELQSSLWRILSAGATWLNIVVPCSRKRSRFHEDLRKGWKIRSKPELKNQSTLRPGLFAGKHSPGAKKAWTISTSLPGGGSSNDPGGNPPIWHPGWDWLFPLCLEISTMGRRRCWTPIMLNGGVRETLFRPDWLRDHVLAGMALFITRRSP